MKRNLLILLQFVLIIFLTFLLVTFLMSTYFTGNIDFPCSVFYDETNDCVSNILPQQYYSESNKIEIHLTYYEFHYSGGGCYYQYSDIETLSLSDLPYNLIIQYYKNNLYVNENILEEGEIISISTPFTLHLWAVYKLNITNHGVIKYCDNQEYETLLVTGDFGTHFSSRKGFVLLLTTLLGIFFTRRKQNQLKTKHE